MILLLFMSKNEYIFEEILEEKLKEKSENLNQEEKSLFQYAISYGTNKSIIENNYKRDENEKKMP